MNAPPPRTVRRGGSRREQGSEPPSPGLLGIEQRGNAELQAACYGLRRVAAALRAAGAAQGPGWSTAKLSARPSGEPVRGPGDVVLEAGGLLMPAAADVLATATHEVDGQGSLWFATQRALVRRN